MDKRTLTAGSADVGICGRMDESSLADRFASTTAAAVATSAVVNLSKVQRPLHVTQPLKLCQLEADQLRIRRFPNPYNTLDDDDDDEDDDPKKSECNKTKNPLSEPTTSTSTRKESVPTKRKGKHSNLRNLGSVEKRNERERSRVHTVNQAFHALKYRLPSLRSQTKRVSKLRILQTAINYIFSLSQNIDKFAIDELPSDLDDNDTPTPFEPQATALRHKSPPAIEMSAELSQPPLLNFGSYVHWCSEKWGGEMLKL